jgi:uncharacterized protein (DUF58 family)
MELNLLPAVTVWLVAFGVLALAGLVTVLTALAVFFRENHTVRVRRHESVSSYYGHLALGH